MDFARPIHPADVALYLAQQLEARAEGLRRSASEILAKADALDEAARSQRGDADMWSRYIPPLPTDGATDA